MNHRFSYPWHRSTLALLLGLAAVLGPTAIAGDAPEQDSTDPATLPDGPDFKEVLSLSRVGSPRISPDGGAIAYTVRTTDWVDNRYDTEIWLAPQGEEPFPLTRTAGQSSTNPQWSPDGKWIAFLADRGEGRQIHLIRPRGGEARPLTAVEDGVDTYRWSPDGSRMAVAMTEPQDESDKKREELYGDFEIEDADYRFSHLWLLDVEAALDTRDGAERPAEKKDPESAAASEEESDAGQEEDASEEDASEEDDSRAFRRLTSGDDFTVGGFEWSPDGRKIAFAHFPDPAITSREEGDLSVVDVESGEILPLVIRPGFDGDPLWSPDGEWILFSTNHEATEYYKNSELAKIPAAGGDVVVLTAGFDGLPEAVAWIPDGIRFLAFRKTRQALFHLDPETGELAALTDSPHIIWDVDVTRDGGTFALVAEDSGKLREIYRSGAEPWQPEPVTAMTEQVAEWPLGSREVISWPSRDQATIEGVLWKPEDFEPGRRYPLLVIIHGGPTWISYPQLVSSYVYPVQQWLAQGTLVLMPNYRGSIGYGEAFRSLNVRNLGVGDAWDVLSGVEHLVDQGLADPERLGAMGWSQGGYISAFLATTSDRFRAISVGAGISNWMTYYVNTDIHPFTRHYLGATPWDDPEIYAKTSPITYVKSSRTPTLIQHGEFDRRVPIPNAYELFQGLRDVGVDTRLVVYEGFGHGITKPKERLAAVWHNWQWFAKYLWEEEVELPLD